MGFSIQQAKDALGATQSGVDVQGALEVLLSGGGSSAGTREGRGDTLDVDHNSDDVLPRQRQKPPPPQHRHRPSPTSSNSNFSTTALNPSQPTQAQTQPPTTLTQLQIQEQADKLLAQASEIGLSVLNRANAFWREGKERARGIYEERGGGSASANANTGERSGSGRGRGANGRPRWMQDSGGDNNHEDEHEDGWGSKENGRQGAFVDDFDGNGEKNERDAPMRKRPSNTRSSRPKPESEPQVQQEAVGDLFGDAPSATTAYVSPFRRGNPLKSSPPAPAPQRPQILASPTALATATAHKQTGNQHYKLGQFSAAEVSYTSAISSLPAQHLLLVPLYNNRALARLKIGDMGGAVEDCSAVVGIVGGGGDLESGGRVVGVGVEGGVGGEGEVVDLREGLVKALTRRAEAWEGKEKWEEAGKDWELLVAVKWVAGNVRGEAVRGAGRCRRMMAGAGTASASMSEESKPKPPAATPKRPPPRPQNPQAPSQALTNLHSTLSAQESEDQQRLELKDSIDARLRAWKGGKETNIRALIASLETILWPELGWQKVGMAEVVSPGQVKVRYMKAIAKLHPDKVASPGYYRSVFCCD
jgi:hypothetical protein